MPPLFLFYCTCQKEETERKLYFNRRENNLPCPLELISWGLSSQVPDEEKEFVIYLITFHEHFCPVSTRHRNCLWT
jgi:hypothetical protein